MATHAKTIADSLTRLRAENAELKPTGWVTPDSKTRPLIKQLTVALDKLGDRDRNSDIIRLGWESARELERRFAEHEADNAALRARMERMEAVVSAAKAANRACRRLLNARTDLLAKYRTGGQPSESLLKELDWATANNDAKQLALAALDTESEVGK
jgi:predicted RNase H-like nuclease (RuvC/YqgF family)